MRFASKRGLRIKPSTLIPQGLLHKVLFAQWWTKNLRRTLSHTLRSNRTSLASEIAAELRQNGIFKCSFQEMFARPAVSFPDALAVASRALEQSRHCRTEDRSHEMKQKAFRVELLSDHIEIDNIFLSLALHPNLLEIASGYMGMRVYLRAVELWWDRPTPGPPMDTQLWHRDSDDLTNIKVFIYFSDVDMESGPFCFVPRTHALGERKLWMAHRNPDGRTSDEQMAAAIPKSEWSICTGRAGTAILCDTTGYHKGLKPVRDHRLMLTFQYTSGAPRYPRAFTIEGDYRRRNFSTAQLYALHSTPSS